MMSISVGGLSGRMTCYHEFAEIAGHKIIVARYRFPRRAVGEQKGLSDIFSAPRSKMRMMARIRPGRAKLEDPCAVRAGESLDTFYGGRVVVRQRTDGYRFALDAPLLADFVRTRPGERLLELGTGSGIIALLLGRRRFARLTALEVQPALADLARRNVRLNGLQDRITVVQRDLRRYRPARPFDVVFSNPPYIRKGTGFLSSSPEKSIAKHEIKCDILQVMRATARCLKKDGRAYFVYPALRADEFVSAAAAQGLHVRRRRFVHPRPGEPAALFLAECRHKEGPLRTLAPLVLRGADGRDAREATRIYEGRRHG
jgi:tRNA1Val (adenine37-N6)-methyltransferase